MENPKFDTPVTVLANAEGGQLNIEDVQAGTDFLLKSWPGRRGEKHRDALQACSDASAGKKPAATARRAFAAAARDAGVLIKR
jgi:hypothetical protein